MHLHPFLPINNSATLSPCPRAVFPSVRRSNQIPVGIGLLMSMASSSRTIVPPPQSRSSHRGGLNPEILGCRSAWQCHGADFSFASLAAHMEPQRNPALSDACIDEYNLLNLQISHHS